MERLRGHRGYARLAKQIEDTLVQLSIVLDQDTCEEAKACLKDSDKVIMAEGLAVLVFLARHCLRLLMLLCGFLAGLFLTALLK